MRIRNCTIILTLVALAAVGCSVSNLVPGIGGSGSGETIESTAHPDVPDGVRCYVCHKEDIPQVAFHEQFSRECEECHGTTTWVAYKYPHERWELGIHRQMQCVRCHTNIREFDFDTWQCWGCHHDEAEMAAFHADAGFDEIDNCILCHQGTPEIESEE